jgi:hypothetical protein
MGVLDRISYIRGGYTGYNGSGPAPGQAPDIGVSATGAFGFSQDQATSDLNVQATGVLIIALAIVVFVAAKGLK